MVVVAVRADGDLKVGGGVSEGGERRQDDGVGRPRHPGVDDRRPGVAGWVGEDEEGDPTLGGIEGRGEAFADLVDAGQDLDGVAGSDVEGVDTEWVRGHRFGLRNPAVPLALPPQRGRSQQGVEGLVRGHRCPPLQGARSVEVAAGEEGAHVVAVVAEAVGATFEAVDDHNDARDLRGGVAVDGFEGAPR